MFREYSKAFRVKILNYMDIIKAKRGDKIIVEGNPTINIYFVLSGKFDTTKNLILRQQKGLSSLESKFKVFIFEVHKIYL